MVETTTKGGPTPGPWEVYAQWIRKADDGHPIIAEVTVYRPSRYTGHQIHEAERDANACLIAKAWTLPALLKAAEAAEEAFLQLFITYNLPTQHEILSQLRGAIAQARGKTK